MSKYLQLRFQDVSAITRWACRLFNNTEIIYENSDGEILRFEYMRVEEGSAIIIDAENMEVTEIGVNGCPGHLYISVDPEQSNCITWYDNGAKMQFIIVCKIVPCNIFLKALLTNCSFKGCLCCRELINKE